jgi:hypothetical protein
MSEPRKNSLKNTLKEERLSEKEKGAEKEKSKSSKNADSKNKGDAKASASGGFVLTVCPRSIWLIVHRSKIIVVEFSTFT